MHFRLLLLLLALARDAIAQSCSSKVYCKSPEIRYMGMRQASNVYLNATAIKSTTTRNIPSCQTQCLRENSCFSININIRKVNEYECHLLAENMYANATLLVKHKDFIHLFLESPCKDNPCKNGGTCLPSYANDSYSCSCGKVNNTFVSSGKYCTDVSSGFRSADYYWTFDKTKMYEFPAFSGTGHEVSGFRFKKTNIKVVTVPRRHSPVAYGKHDPSAKPIFFLSHAFKIPCLNTFSGCETGVTYSLWIKIAEAEMKKDKDHNIFFTAFAGTGYKQQGIKFYLSKKGDMNFHLITATKFLKLDNGFGRNIKISQWNHFAFTYSSVGPLCGYINGKSEQCASVFSSINIPHTTNDFRIGYQFPSETSTEMYIDHLAVWRSALSAAEIKDVYYHSKV